MRNFGLNLAPKYNYESFLTTNCLFTWAGPSQPLVPGSDLVSVPSHRRLKHERCELLLFNETKAHFNDHTASFSYFSTNIYHSSYGIVLCNCGYNQSIELMIQ